jgi:integral membrane protein
MNFKTILGTLRIVAILEGISYISFAITMPLKYSMGIEAPNKIVGYIHGALFLAYILFAYWHTSDARWSIKNKIYAFLASIIPFGTFVLDHKLLKPEQQANAR